jgi:hypothetical protein
MLHIICSESKKNLEGMVPSRKIDMLHSRELLVNFYTPFIPNWILQGLIDLVPSRKENLAKHQSGMFSERSNFGMPHLSPDTARTNAKSNNCLGTVLSYGVLARLVRTIRIARSCTPTRRSARPDKTHGRSQPKFPIPCTAASSLLHGRPVSAELSGAAPRRHVGEEHEIARPPHQRVR